MKNVKLPISERIQEIRKDAQLTQKELGALLLVSQDTISLWEKGKSYPSAEQIVLICKQFKISADYLLGLSDY